MKKYFPLIVFVLLLLACKDKNVKTEVEEKFSLAKTEYTILPFSENSHYIFKDVTASSLSEKELIEIEIILQEMILEHNVGQAKTLEKHNKEYPKYQWKETRFELKTEGYRRQYLPVINEKGEKGEKEVWINFFCAFDTDDVYWRTIIPQVADGGNCYYSFKVNLATKEIYDLHINGYA